MKYIYTNSNGVAQFDKYFQYLKSIQGQLPENVFSFAANVEHYDLSSHSSLHDAWLENIDIREIGQGERHEQRQTEIKLCLLGAFHDRHIYLTYKDVQKYCLSAAGALTGHGDLLVHEVQLSDSGSLIHELQFEKGNIQIECKDILHEEIEIPTHNNCLHTDAE